MIQWYDLIPKYFVSCIQEMKIIRGVWYIINERVDNNNVRDMEPTICSWNVQQWRVGEYFYHRSLKKQWMVSPPPSSLNTSICFPLCRWYLPVNMILFMIVILFPWLILLRWNLCTQRVGNIPCSTKNGPWFWSWSGTCIWSRVALYGYISMEIL